ncbi:MAG TPA: 16S rRNA (cytosine(1402)-N(4))-methyltransferase RsmH, partial [Acidobacteriota bacterium]|nr:16S rRNA (cytosine(1402)-N(4))-methyltransferase RsmH [Acidobacteriota bacterium]
EASAPGGFLLAIDRDEDAIRYSQQRLSRFGNRFKLIRGDYRMIQRILAEQEIGQPAGVLADLGASMLQFSQPERGFSFQAEGPLDMRMDRGQSLTAEQIINQAPLEELSRIFREYGEERAAHRVARRIVEERQSKPIRTTGELASFLKRVLPERRRQSIHPATRIFQALRIAVNRELEGLDEFVFDAFDSLVQGGRLVVIAFHSLEDRIIKHSFQFLSAACRCSRALMSCVCGGKPLSRTLTPRPVAPPEEEIERNPASRSARLRALEKIEGPVPRQLWKVWLEERKG